MMREIGGYIELDKFKMPMLHDGAMSLNCGRNCLLYLLKVRTIEKIYIPKFLCDSVGVVCREHGVLVYYYSIGQDFMPESLDLKEDEWLYLVNFYGQITNVQIEILAKRSNRIIVDNAHAYYQLPVENIDTIYTCRKYFGVPDGAFLYTNVKDRELLETMPLDKSYERMKYILGRFEESGQEHYGEYLKCEKDFDSFSIRRMSKLTENLLHAIDYEFVKRIRTKNFVILHSALGDVNKLKLRVPEGAFMYPLYIRNGAQIRKKLLEKNIYIPILWPDVFDKCDANELEYDMAINILPLPVDQRYERKEMQIIVEEIFKNLEYGDGGYK